ncbi:glycosyltransferase [Amycolatopsis sp. NPDC059021]|uniref:glycosyltransferase n=1 Tax=Amycolatopsis sp. NPDC059021 TaxID=3346704 RepID=UPI003672AB6D
MTRGADPGPEAGVTEQLLDPRAPDDVSPALAAAARALDGRQVWHVNTTALGGGVAELIRVTVPEHTAAGVGSRWLVTQAPTGFFTMTKQLHHLLHGMPGNGRALTPADGADYAAITAEHAAAVLRRAGRGDLVVLHDPQTLGLAPALRDAGMRVIWRSHIGTRRESARTASAWRFLAPFLDGVHQLVFTSPSYVPAHLSGRAVAIIPPAIDPRSPRCRPMPAGEISAVLGAIGLQNGPPIADLATAARVVQDEHLPADAPVVAQISRWDPLKDMRGVLEAFAAEIAPGGPSHLVLAGPDPDEVADDLENRAVLADVLDAYARLPPPVRRRVHLAILRLSAREANGRIVNAVQRRATVLVQKSLREGFGLAVTEAMHKRRPVVASAVGGIVEQITHRVHGLLVPPRDARALGAAVRELLGDPGLATSLATAAGAHCDRTFLVAREHERYARLFLAAVSEP